VRVVVFSELFRPYVGGIEVLADQLLPALIHKGHEIQVVTSHGPMPLPDEESFGALLVRRYPFRALLEGKDPEGMLILRQRLGRLLRELDPDVIHFNGMAASLLFVLPLVSAGRAAVLVQLHQRLFPSEELRDSLAVRVLCRADWVVSVSAAALAQARAAVPEIEARSSILRNAVHAPDLIPSPLSFTPPRLLCLGRLTPQKGFDLALRAVAVLTRRFPDVRVVIAGDGDERAPLEALAESLGIDDRCEWRGWVRPGDVAGVIDEAAIVVLSSRYEGLPLVAIEAAWMARPVVATRVGGMAEVVRHQETGLLVEPENVDELAAALARLLERPEDARRMGTAARRRVESEFAWEECVAAYDALYRQLGALMATRQGAA
jgi:glycogen(starch) synthase